ISGSVNSIFKSTDAGGGWNSLNLTDVSIVIIDPKNASSLYALTGAGFFKSTDGGSTWSLVGQAITSLNATALAIDPTNSLIIYAAGHVGADAFVTKLNDTGSALVYSTYIGGAGQDSGNSIAVDSAGNAYVTGDTSSANFPTQNAFQSKAGGDATTTDAFVLKLNPTGAALIYSSYLGGSGSDSGASIALDSLGHAYITGFTTSNDFPTASPIQAKYGGGSLDSFTARIALPVITSVAVKGKKLLVSGDGFDVGATIMINGQQQKTVNDETAPASLLIVKKGAKSIPPGQAVTIQVKGASGELSNEVPFIRTAG